MNYKEIWTKLNDIHTEFAGEITPEALEAAWEKGYVNPCGCSICHLMEAITIAEIGAETERDITLTVDRLTKSWYT